MTIRTRPVHVIGLLELTFSQSRNCRSTDKFFSAQSIIKSVEMNTLSTTAVEDVQARTAFKAWVSINAKSISRRSGQYHGSSIMGLWPHINPPTLPPDHPQLGRDSGR